MGAISNKSSNGTIIWYSLSITDFKCSNNWFTTGILLLYLTFHSLVEVLFYIEAKKVHTVFHYSFFVLQSYIANYACVL